MPPPLPKRTATPPEPEPAPRPDSELEPEPTPELAAAAVEAPPASYTPFAKDPPKSTTFANVEQALGLRWLTWIGIAMLFLGVAFFLKYAYDRDWLGRFFGPRLRIATAAAGATTLVVLGIGSLRNGMQALGQGLLGGGQALAYLTIFAAYQPAMFVVDAPLVGPTATFALMVAVTAVGLVLAVRLDAIAMAFLAVLGGFATPALIHTGSDSRDVLCVYLLLLDLGVLWVAAHRRWRALDLLAFGGTSALFAGWWFAYGDLHPQPDATLTWVAIFHLVFAVLPFVPHWRLGTPVTLERFVLALANLAATLLFLGGTLHTAAPNFLAACCLLGAPFYLGLGYATAKRVGTDERTRDGFLALAVFLLTLGLFYLLPVGRIATAWFVEAVALTWLGYRFAHAPTRRWAVALFVLAFARTCMRFSDTIDFAAPFVVHGRFGTLLVAGLAAMALAFMHRRHGANDTERLLARGFGIGAGFWFLGVGTEEIARHASTHPDAWQTMRPAVAAAFLHTFGALAFLAWACRNRSGSALIAGLLPLAASAVATLVAYSSYPADAWAVLNGSFAAGACACAALVVFALLAHRCGDPAASSATGSATGSAASRGAWLGTAQLACTALATLETAAFLQRGTEVPTPTTLAEALGWVWLGIGGAGAVFAAALPSRRVLALALVPLAMSCFVPFVLYGHRLDPHVLVSNTRYLFAAATCAAAAALRRPLQRSSLGSADLASAAGFALLLLWSTLEVAAFSDTNFDGRRAAAWTTWLFGLVAVLGTMGGAWRAHATANALLRTAARAVLVAAVPLPFFVYATDFPMGWMFVNPRFLLVVGAVLATLVWLKLEPRHSVLGRVALGLCLLGLTLEPPAWFLEHIADRAEAGRLAKFAITVTWVLAAVVLLGVGFRRDRRGLRLCALGLFALIAVKLLAFDMSGAQQIYRILAFILVGIVFVTASWLYHRVERRLAAARKLPD